MIKIKECKKIMKTCKQCGNMIHINSFGKNKYSKDGKESICKYCKKENRYKYECICKCCGTTFKAERKDRKFCSKRCSSEYRDNKEFVTCNWCGKQYKEKHYRVSNNNHFCSRECLGKYRSKFLKGENSPLNKKIIKKCSYCKKEITVRQSRDFEHNFCSQECHGKWRKENLLGENNYNWNPNLTDREREQRRNIEGYDDFIKDVYERDNYTCQVCGQEGNGHNLNAHHLNGYNWYKEGRTDINNGITLCETCHKEFHKLYGQGNNTKEQFEEYLKNKEEKEVV